MAALAVKREKGENFYTVVFIQSVVRFFKGEVLGIPPLAGLYCSANAGPHNFLRTTVTIRCNRLEENRSEWTAFTINPA